MKVVTETNRARVPGTKVPYISTRTAEILHFNSQQVPDAEIARKVGVSRERVGQILSYMGRPVWRIRTVREKALRLQPWEKYGYTSEQLLQVFDGPESCKEIGVQLRVSTMTVSKWMGKLKVSRGQGGPGRKRLYDPMRH